MNSLLLNYHTFADFRKVHDDYYYRKMKEGKKHLQVMNSIKNKMLLSIVAVVNSQTPYVNN